MEDEVIEIYIAQSHNIDNLELKEVNTALEKIRSFIHANFPDVYTSIHDTKLLSEETKKHIDDATKAVLEGLH